MVQRRQRRKSSSVDERGHYDNPTMVQIGRHECDMDVDNDTLIPDDREDSPMDVDGDYINDTVPFQNYWQLQLSFMYQLHTCTKFMYQ